MKYAESYRARFSELGEDGRLTNRGFLSIMEDLADRHAVSIGHGAGQAQQIGFTWLLLGWQLKVYERPDHEEDLKAYTWSRGFERCYAYRDFEIKAEDGRILAEASSKWLLIDAVSFRPKKITPEIQAAYGAYPEDHVFEEEEIRWNHRGRYEGEQELAQAIYKVGWRDIDMNHHMHNVSYADIPSYVLPEELRREYNEMTIIYKKEIKYGEEMLCRVGRLEDTIIISLEEEGKNHSTILLRN